MADLSSFGARIKQLRRELNLSQREFAEKIGVTASSLSAYEQGQKNPSVGVAIEIAVAFNVSLDWLCGLKKDSNRFKPDDIIWFDLPKALSFLLDMLHAKLVSIPQTEESEEYGYYDCSSLDVSNASLEEFIHDAITLEDLYANGSISYENYKVCIDEMIFTSADAIRRRKRMDKEQEEKRREAERQTGNPFA